MTTNPLRSAHWAFVLLVLAVACLSIQAQEMKERELKADFDLAGMQMPIEIVSIKINGKEVQPGEKINGNDDWLRGVSFTLKNVSDKAIAYVCIGFKFAQPKRILVHYLSYGVDLSRGAHRSDSSPPAIQPGESLDLVLTKEGYEILLRNLERAEMSPFDMAPYYVDRISFENEPDVIWAAGTLRRRHPTEIARFDFIERYVLPTRQR
jgi:hypothetical protein